MSENYTYGQYGHTGHDGRPKGKEIRSVGVGTYPNSGPGHYVDVNCPFKKREEDPGTPVIIGGVSVIVITDEEIDGADTKELPDGIEGLGLFQRRIQIVAHLAAREFCKNCSGCPPTNDTE